MVDVAAIAALTKNTIVGLTDVVGLIEKNIASYDRVTERFRRKRLAKRFDHILRLLVDFRQNNMVTLMGIAERMQRQEDVEFNPYLDEPVQAKSIPANVIRSWAKRYLDENRGRKFSHDTSLTGFFTSLLEARDVITRYKSDIISVDYSLYEEIDDAVMKRVDITEILRDNDNISPEKLQIIYNSYVELMLSIETLKDRLQSMSKDTSKN